jgi:hypothetical protein
MVKDTSLRKEEGAGRETIHALQALRGRVKDVRVKQVGKEATATDTQQPPLN